MRPSLRLLLAPLAVGLVLAGAVGCGGRSTSTTSAPPVTTVTSAPTPFPYDAAQQGEMAGSTLYLNDGCEACHSLNGQRGVGPSFQSLGNSFARLRDGHRVLVTFAFIREAIATPAKAPIAGYPLAPMRQASARLGLAHRPKDVAALADFIEADGP
ncbi:MAG TPA: cytochrome c [Solirubrobacteraceae bacterium]|nr:cytochrome c [Solirubrobacteraceae bacterium]